MTPFFPFVSPPPKEDFRRKAKEEFAISLWVKMAMINDA